MKENFNYENHTDEIKKNLEVGFTCVNLLVSGIYKEMKPIVEYRIRDAFDSRLRSAWLKEKIKSV